MRRALIGLLGLAACEGQIFEPPGASPPGAFPVSPTAPTVFVPAPVTMRRLTVREYANSVEAVLAGPVTAPKWVEPIDRTGYGFTTIGAGQAVYSEAGIEALQDAAFDAAAEVFADASRRAAFLGTCNAPTGPTDACVGQWLASTGRRAFRRPLSPDELDRYTGLISAGATAYDTLTGMQYATAALLGSPGFLFRAELGTPAGDGTLAFHGYELAARLSYLLWEAPPDDTLLDAAADGSLDTPGGLDAQLDRLLGEARARPAVLEFFSEHFALDLLDSLVKDLTAFPRFTPSLGASMRQELVSVLQDLVFDRDTDVRELFTTRETFVDGPMSDLYGLPHVDSLTKTTFPPDGDRAGLMGFPAILAAQSHAVATSPTERGKFIRERLLGQHINPPPANVDLTAFQMTDPSTPRTMRERLAAHATNPTCAACHTLLDPPGLGLEHFDALGQYQAMDHGLALDTAETLDGAAFDGPAQLGALLAQDPRATRALVTQLYQYAVGHALAEGEVPAIDTLHDALAAQGYRVMPLLRALAHHPGFLTAGAMP
jgi:hypothetical protein